MSSARRPFRTETFYNRATTAAVAEEMEGKRLSLKLPKKVKAQRAEKEKANKKQAKKVLADIDDRISKAKQDGDYRKVVFLQATKHKYQDMLK